MTRLYRLASVALLSVLPGLAAAQTQEDVLSARLLPGWQTDHGTYIAALQLDLAPGWKTYWRSPGDAGIPPDFNWSGSDNLGAIRLHWPRPHVFLSNGLNSIGYKNELVLPIEITPKDATRPVGLRATVDLGVCDNICMPASLSFAAQIGGQGGADPLIDAALAARPSTAREAGLHKIGCTVEPIEDGLRITARLALPPTGGAETVVFEPGTGSVWVSEARVTRQGGTLMASADMVSNTGAPVLFDRQAMIVTVIGDTRAVEISGCPAP